MKNEGTCICGVVSGRSGDAGYVYGVAFQKRYIGQVHRFGALCTAPNSVHWCTEFGALVHRI